MPEYLAPGVYVVEIEGAVEPIPGVPTRIGDEDLRAVALAIRERLARLGPQWTDANDGDPGVTLLEFFAWLTEALIYRTGTLPERGRPHAARLAAGALALLDDTRPVRDGALRHVRLLRGWRARLIQWIA
jgi:hypothetical protein